MNSTQTVNTTLPTANTGIQYPHPPCLATPGRHNGEHILFSGSLAVQSPQRQQTRGDLVTINKSDDDIKCVEDPVNDWALQQHRAGNRNPRFISASRAERREMMKEGMWPLNGANKIPPKPVPMDGNDNTERDPTIWVQKTVYSGSDQPPRYEYIKSPTTGSESSQCPDTDSSDDDGHRECGQVGYENCPDNPANHRAMNHQRGDSDGC